MKPRLISWVLALLLSVTCMVPAGAVEPVRQTTILFTHDLHSHFLPQPVADGESGGYARLKTAIDAERAAHEGNDVLLLDGGDFSIGSLIHTLTTTHAPELRLMGQMGYDATTIGNHEFDHESTGLARMLYAAKNAQAAAVRVLAESTIHGPLAKEYAEQYGPLTWALPAIVMSNYTVSKDNPDREFVQQALDNYGVEETLIIEKNGLKYGLFGLMGVDADECAPTSGFTLEEAVAAAKRCVGELKGQGADFIICLSHAGTGETLPVSEDEELAKAVDGIDVILSGHTHTVLDEPIVVDDTYIISAGPYSGKLGVLTVEWNPTGERELVEYRLVSIDETLAEDAKIAANVEELKELVGEEYLARYGLTYDQVLTTADFELVDPNYSAHSGNNLGEMIADSFLWAVENLEADAPDVETVSVTACGVIRAAMPAGALTTSQAFDVLSMGVGSDGTSGFPLVGVYLTGKELKAAAEVDASVTPIMPAAQLYMGGIRYSFNVHRMLFNRITQALFSQFTFYS